MAIDWSSFSTGAGVGGLATAAYHLARASVWASRQVREAIIDSLNGLYPRKEALADLATKLDAVAGQIERLPDDPKLRSVVRHELRNQLNGLLDRCPYMIKQEDEV